MSDVTMANASLTGRKRGRDEDAPPPPPGQGDGPPAKRRRAGELDHQAHDVSLLLKADPRNTYHVGQYGAANSERELFASDGLRFTPVRVPGASHESEHVVGYAVLAFNGPKRKSGGLAATVENQAPAYLEVNPLHRLHVGTGTSQEATQYRAEQRSLLTQTRTEQVAGPDGAAAWQPGAQPIEKRVSSAFQLNQLHYAPMFRQAETGAVSQATTNSKGESKTRQKALGPDFADHLKVANTSYQAMTVNLQSVTIVEGDGVTTHSINATQIERCEIELARLAAVTGRWPGNAEVEAVMRRHGVTPKVIWRLIKKQDAQAGAQKEVWTKFIV